MLEHGRQNLEFLANQGTLLHSGIFFYYPPYCEFNMQISHGHNSYLFHFRILSFTMSSKQKRYLIGQIQT